MKSFLINVGTLCTVTAAIVLVHITPGAADGWVHHRHQYKRQVAYFEYSPDYGTCRVGWWQTLRYGHVRPRWGAWCR